MFDYENDEFQWKSVFHSAVERLNAFMSAFGCVFKFLLLKISIRAP